MGVEGLDIRDGPAVSLITNELRQKSAFREILERVFGVCLLLLRKVLVLFVSAYSYFSEVKTTFEVVKMCTIWHKLFAR